MADKFYVNSEKIRVYPTAYRGKSQDNKKLYDPESRLFTEQNTVRPYGTLADYSAVEFKNFNGFVINSDQALTTCLEFVLDGYYFYINDGLDHIIGSNWDSKDIYACIKISQKTTTSSTDNTQYIVKNLTAIGIENQTLDFEDKFHGLQFTTSFPEDATLSYLLISRNGHIPEQSKIKYKTESIHGGKGKPLNEYLETEEIKVKEIHGWDGENANDLLIQADNKINLKADKELNFEGKDKVSVESDEILFKKAQQTLSYKIPTDKDNNTDDETHNSSVVHIIATRDWLNSILELENSKVFNIGTPESTVPVNFEVKRTIESSGSTGNLLKIKSERSSNAVKDFIVLGEENLDAELNGKLDIADSNQDFVSLNPNDDGLDDLETSGKAESDASIYTEGAIITKKALRAYSGIDSRGNINAHEHDVEAAKVQTKNIIMNGTTSSDKVLLCAQIANRQGNDKPIKIIGRRSVTGGTDDYFSALELEEQGLSLRSFNLQNVDPSNPASTIIDNWHINTDGEGAFKKIKLLHSDTPYYTGTDWNIFSQLIPTTGVLDPTLHLKYNDLGVSGTPSIDIKINASDLSLETTGLTDVTFDNAVVEAQSYNATSDLRLKENIKSFKPERSILDLDVKEFDFRLTKKHAIGCIAQDLQQICPEIVHEDKDGFLTIEESKIVYLLLDEVKKLKAEIEDLKK